MASDGTVAVWCVCSLPPVSRLELVEVWPGLGKACFLTNVLCVSLLRGKRPVTPSLGCLAEIKVYSHFFFPSHPSVSGNYTGSPSVPNTATISLSSVSSVFFFQSCHEGKTMQHTCTVSERPLRLIVNMPLWGEGILNEDDVCSAEQRTNYSYSLYSEPCKFLIPM